MKDDVRQPLGMKPGPAMAGEGKRVCEVKRTGLRNPTTSGKVPPEIRALHRGETKGPAGQDDGEPPEERNRSRLAWGHRWRAAFAPRCRPAGRRGLLRGARVPHPRPPSTPITPPSKDLLRDTCALPLIATTSHTADSALPEGSNRREFSRKDDGRPGHVSGHACHSPGYHPRAVGRPL